MQPRSLQHCDSNSSIHFLSTMRSIHALVLLWLSMCGTISANLCTTTNKNKVGRIVFGEARGETPEGQLAVAYTVVNRVNHAGYPNTVHNVVYAKYGNRHEYNTLDHPTHGTNWESAKKNNNAEYNAAITAASGALCKTKNDPTVCAVNFCADDPSCPTLKSNRYWTVYCSNPSNCPQKIGRHYFVCRKKAT